MSVLEEQTPCPSPRPGGGSAFPYHARLQALPARSNRAPEVGRNLLNVRPRRQKNIRQSLAWDPTIDIYDDSFAFRKPEDRHAQSGQIEGSRPRHTDNISAELRPGDSQAQSPQTNVLEAASPNPANVTRRRSSILDQPLQGAHVSVAHADRAMESQNLQEDIKRYARRRTIYVPSDDTTVLTIHPGASFSARNTNRSRPRRSDIFLDLATLPESGEKQRYNAVRSSLAVAPRRAPLKASTRQLQVSAFVEDIAGSGDGKENVPPGRMVDGEKVKNWAMFSPFGKAYQKPTVNSIARSASSSPMKPSTTQALSNDARQSPTIPQRMYSLKQAKSSPLRQDPAFSSTLQNSEGVSVNSSTGSTKAEVSAYSSPLRSSLLHRKPPQQRSPPRVSQTFAEPHIAYPVLEENISNPELYEDHWLSHQEMTFATLMNSLFEGAGHNTASQSSSTGFLRTKLLQLHGKADNVTLHKRIQASLRFGALSISNGTLSRVARLKDDLAQRQKFLDLWLKVYDLELLYAASEVVIGREANQISVFLDSPTSKNPKSSVRQASRCLEAFLNTCLLRNEDGMPVKTSVSTSPISTKPYLNDFEEVGSVSWAWRRTVTRSLLLILLLDNAVTGGTFRQNLFQTSSPHKSSLSVLQSLSALLLPSIGDISRVLGHLSYQVTHIQYPLQEYTYRVRNLATDLRDGILLTRLVDLLSFSTGSCMLKQNHKVRIAPTDGDMRSFTSSLRHHDPKGAWALSTNLKYPCPSRVQKLHNAEIALTALQNFQDIEHALPHTTAKDIVDGHREKTVALLWALISHWGLGALLDFSLVEGEIKHICAIDGDTHEGNEEELDSSWRSDLNRHQTLLFTWARRICRRNGIKITNLGTSFADGNAYAALVQEYAIYASSPSSSVTTISSIASNAMTTEANKKVNLSQSLRALGISSSFASLLHAPSTKAPVIPSPKTTVSVLAFLAAKLLPLRKLATGMGMEMAQGAVE